MRKNPNVFVTGGNGFLGSCLVQRLVEEANIVCLIKEPRLSRFYLDGTDSHVILVPGTVEHADFGSILADYSIDTVFHLAAQPIVKDALLAPLPMFDTNIRGTFKLLEAARLHTRLQSIVVVTSDKVYGDSEKLPYVETDPLLGRGPYDASKVCCDVLAQSYASSYNMPIGIARLGNLYGPGDTQWSRIIPGTIRSLLSGESPIIRSDGTLERDYLYVDDAVEGLLALGLSHHHSEAHREAYNFGTGIPITVDALVGELIRRSGRDVTPVIKNETRCEIQRQYLDCTKARKQLGWRYRTALPEGLNKTWDWYAKVVTTTP